MLCRLLPAPADGDPGIDRVLPPGQGGQHPDRVLRVRRLAQHPAVHRHRLLAGELLHQPLRREGGVQDLLPPGRDDLKI